MSTTTDDEKMKERMAKVREAKLVKRAEELVKAEELKKNPPAQPPIITALSGSQLTGLTTDAPPTQPVTLASRDTEFDKLKVQLEEQGKFIKDFYTKSVSKYFKPEEIVKMSITELKAASDTITRFSTDPKGVPREPDTTPGENKGKIPPGTYKAWDGKLNKYIEHKEKTYQ